MRVSFVVNKAPVMLDVAPDRRLLDILREDLHLTGTKEGCGEGECGACTVLLEGRAVHACLTLAIELEGKHVFTVEGLSEEKNFAVLQRCFAEELAIQCGFCTPGMLISAWSPLTENNDPTEGEIRRALSGNICRCSGYGQLINAIRRAAVELREGEEVC